MPQSDFIDLTEMLFEGRLRYIVGATTYTNTSLIDYVNVSVYHT